ncbi:MAG: protein kinase [Gemmatimonadales bacterium]
MSNPVDRLGTALVGRYTIERELGQGGMATVYLAHDVRHDRKVALKVLRPELAAVLGGERFLSEIKTTANLQHPHILPLHDSGEADGMVFYVMPYVEGESLRDRLTREKQLPVEEAVRLAREVLSALDYAHRKNVVHRDIKPENILLHEGQALVADFGIALAVSTAGAGTRMTETGMSLGTPHYMAPEQAMGEREITPKADIYAAGCVLYEMLSAEPPFTGATAQAIVARVVTEEPRSLTLQRKTVPPNVEAAVLTALAKLPADRFATAAQFADALGKMDYTLPATRARPALRAAAGGSPMMVRALVAALVLAVAGAAWGWLRPRALPPAPPVERFTLTFPRNAEASDAVGSPIAVSPDGSRIVYFGLDSQRTGWLFSRAMDRMDPAVIAGTRAATQPFFSPDGQWVGFIQEGKLRKVSLAGGAVVTICDAGGLQGASWGPDDFMVFSARGRLQRVAAAGGAPVFLAAPDSGRPGAFRWPEVMPDGRTVLFTQVTAAGPVLAALSLADLKVRPLNQPGMSPHYVESGYLVFAQADGTLFAAPFDARGVRFTGSPQPIVEAVRLGGAFVAKLGISRTGSLAHLAGSSLTRDLMVVDRTGHAQALPIASTRFAQARYSPDGRRIAVAIDNSGAGVGDIWVYDLAARNLARLTFDSTSAYPSWDPDGRHVTFAKSTGVSGGHYSLFRVASDGSGVPETVLVRTSNLFEAEYTRDGRIMVFRETDAQTNRDIWFMRADSPATAKPLLRTPYEERQLAVSPDGRWLAYSTNETGADEVYVRHLAEGSARWKVSTAGGNEPRWNRNGRELFFMRGDSLYSVPLPPPSGGDFRSGAPRALLEIRRYQTIGNTLYDVAPDGNHFVYVRNQIGQTSEQMGLILHWFDNLKRQKQTGPGTSGAR